MWLLKVLATIMAAGFTAASAIPKIENLAHTLGKRAGGTCSSGDFAAVLGAGSSAGTGFCESAWGTSFVPVSTIEVWWVYNYVTGIRYTYADGTQSPVYGQPSDYGGQALSVNYALGDRFTHLYIYPGPNYIRHMDIRASNGGVIHAGVPVQYGDPGYGLAYDEPDVGAGVLLGGTGTSSDGLNSIAFLFLGSPVTGIVVTDLQFPNGPTGGQNLHPETLQEGHFFNSQSTGNLTWTFENERAMEVSTAFQQTSANMYGTSENFSVMAGIPMFISFTAGVGFTWSNTYTEQHTLTETKTITVHWTESGSLTPGTGVDVAALVSTGSGTFPYTSTVTMTLANGSKYTYAEAGAITINAVSDAIVTVNDDNTPPSTPPKAG